MNVLGNHEDSIIVHGRRFLKNGTLPHNEDKRQTVKQLTAADLDYIAGMPRLHVIDDLNLVIVHGGVWPDIPLYAQPPNVVRAQLIKPFEYGRTRWWGRDAGIFGGKTEADLLKEGWRRWYHLYDYEQDCVYGHSTFAQPKIDQNPGCGRTIGIDTGSCFGGSVTAAIFDRSGTPFFVSIKAKRVWYPNPRRSFWED